MTLTTQALSAGPLTAFQPADGEAIKHPERAESGYWVGCPTVIDHPDGSVVLTYRERRPRGVAPERGWRLAIATSTDGVDFTDAWSLQKDRLGTDSMEGSCLVPLPGGGWSLLLSYTDAEDKRWRIDAVEAAELDGFDPDRLRPVLTADSTGTEGVKDPVVVRDGPVWYLLASFAEAAPIDAGNRDAAHHNADIYTTGLTTHPTGLASGVDGRDWTWHGRVLDVGTGWDGYQARVTSAIRAGSSWLGFYDGSASATENYEEKVGLATSGDLRSWLRLTPDGPWVTGGGGTGSVRYLSALPRGDELWIYYEYACPDGSHDLRRAILPAIAATGTGA